MSKHPATIQVLSQSVQIQLMHYERVACEAIRPDEWLVLLISESEQLAATNDFDDTIVLD